MGITADILWMNVSDFNVIGTATRGRDVSWWKTTHANMQKCTKHTYKTVHIKTRCKYKQTLQISKTDLHKQTLKTIANTKDITKYTKTQEKYMFSDP